MLKTLKKNSLYKFLVEKSKRMSWIDMLGISLFFFLLLIGFLFFTRRSQDISITVRLLDSNSPPAIYNFPRQLFTENLRKGLKEKGQLGNTVAEITDVYKYRSADVNQDVFVTMKINSIYNSQTGQYSYDNLPLLIGDYRTFQLQDIVFSGVVVDINSTGSPREKKMFSVTGFLDPVNNTNFNIYQQVAVFNGVSADGIKNFLADQVKPGLKITDTEGKTAAEVTSVNKTTGKISLVQNGTLITVDDPQTKRVDVTLNILADKVGDAYFFQKEQSLNVGNSIFLDFDNIKMVLTITSVAETN